MNNFDPTQTIDMVPAKKSPFKKPLTLVAALFFLLVTIIPLILLFAPTPAADNTEYPPALVAEGTTLYMTTSEKIEGIAGAIENVFYPPYEESNMNMTAEQTELKKLSRKEFFVTGTWIMFITMVVSSALMGTALILMYFSPGFSYNIKSVFMIICIAVAAAGTAILTYMHIYSIFVLLTRLGSIPTNMNFKDQQARDACTTETVYYLLRNILVTAGLVYYLFNFLSFSVSSTANKTSKKKLLKKAKGLTSGFTTAALVCSYYAIVIALTWTFNFTTKALLATIVLMATTSFVMIGLSCDFRKRLKHHIDNAPALKKTQAICPQCKAETVTPDQTFCENCGYKF